MIDEILDKINLVGYDKLTDIEKAILKNCSTDGAIVKDIVQQIKNLRLELDAICEKLSGDDTKEKKLQLLSDSFSPIANQIYDLEDQLIENFNIRLEDYGLETDDKISDEDDKI